MTCTTFATPWTVVYQAPLSTGFSRQEYQSELPFPSPGDLLDPGIKPEFLTFPAAGEFFTTEPLGKPQPSSETLASHNLFTGGRPCLCVEVAEG